MEQTEHIITIENRKKISATAIESVDSFSPTQIVVSHSGGKIIVSGGGMKIINFSKSSGQFTASGEINAFKYVAKGTSVKQKLFK